MATAFVLAGGGSLGATEVGMLAALTDADVRPDFMVGTSVGAANAVWFALHPSDVDYLADRWVSLRRTDVFPIRPVRGLLGLLGVSDHLVPNSRLRRLLERSLGPIDLTGTEIPVHVGATDVLSGEEVLLSSGNAVSCVLASTAIPAVFPPLHLDGRCLMDGGAVNNNPVSHAVELRVVPPLCPLQVSPGDFSRARELIDAAHASTRDWLTAGCPAGSAHQACGTTRPDS